MGTCQLGLVLLSLISVAAGSDVLLFMSLGSKSHTHLALAFAEGLVERGHRVTILNGFPAKEKRPGIDQVAPKELVEYTTRILHGNMFTSREEKGSLKFFYEVSHTMAIGHCEALLQSKEAIQLLNKKFDLVVIDGLASDCALAFSYKHRVPFVYYAVVGYNPGLGASVGNPYPASVAPFFLLPYSHDMTFQQRAVNALVTSFYRNLRYYVTLPRIRKVLQQYVPDIPPLEEYEKNASLVFVNQHFSMEYPRPYLPSVIEIGGIHCQEAKPLPTILEDFMKSSGEHGVIYFSFGTIVKASDMPVHIRQAFLDAFSKLKQKVIWKWEDESLSGITPKNVLIQKWLPQQDILGHAKTRLFITHGGLLSQQEAVFHGVPLLTIPFFADQDNNAARAQDAGYGLVLDVNDITEERLLKDLTELLQNPRYRQEAKKISQIFNDQPQTPKQRAVYWAEYVIRHNGAPHLQSPARHLSVYTYYLVDIIAAAIVAVIAMYYFIRKVFRIIKNTMLHKEKRE